MSYRERTSLWFLTALIALALGAGLAVAQTPQTIVIDGVNDFLPGNLLDADALDVQLDPAPDFHPQLDIQNIHLTNDAVNLYVGFQKHASPYGGTQFGIAIDVGTAAGGSADPWGRAIEWSSATNKPDFMFYVNLDSGWEAGYSWNGSSWVDMAPPGFNSLGWETGTEFSELAIMLGALGLSAGNQINFEMWLTQDGGTKGPLDAAANDGSQLSLPGLTLWDVPSAIPMTLYNSYTVQAAADPDPPVVAKFEPAAIPVDSFFDVFFNEPIETATGEVTGNYTVTGANVIGAVRDGSDPSIVRLELDTILAESASLYQVTVANVKDLAGNPITQNGVDNTGCVGLKKVVFRGKFGPFLTSLGISSPDTFSVEGGKAPLTFDPVCDTGMMVYTGLDDIYEYSTLMSYEGDCTGGTGSETFEWKFNHDCGTWEPLASNRTHTLDLANGAIDTLEFWWNDDDPTQFTAHDIDVLFFVDMSGVVVAPGDSVSINGSLPPLNFNVPPELQLADDGVAPDLVAGDEIWSIQVTFPAGSKKNLDYKFLHNSSYECQTLGDRNLFLNDELFDTVGGTLGPLELPVVTYDFCNAIWRAVEVVFTVDFNNTAWWNIKPADVVTVNGTPNNAEPPTFDWTVPSLTVMADDGVAPDQVAGDKIYTVSVVFPDTSAQNVEYKYLVNDVYEGPSRGNRYFSIDPDNYDAQGNPQILPVDVYQSFNLSPVPELGLATLQLDQNKPNPFNPSTEISFNVTKAGMGSLRIYNVRGETVRTLRSGRFATGPGLVVWDGRSDSGRAVGSGVYFYRLEVGTEVVTKQMVLLK